MAESVTIAARPHPLRREAMHLQIPAGMTLRDIVGPAPLANLCVAVDGEPIARERWDETRTTEGQVVNIYVVPLGGNGHKLLRTVLQIAVLVASFEVAGLAGGLNTLGGALAAAATSAVGNLLINAIVPPPQLAPTSLTSSSFNRLQSITGTSNQLTPYGAIPRVYGTMRYYPPLAARPVTEISGDQQYLRMLFMLGYGDLDLSAYKIGDTALSSFTGTEYQLGTNAAPPSLFALDIGEDVTTTPALNNDGDVATRTTALATDEISLDLIWAQGLFAVSDSDGSTLTVTQTFTIEYAVAGSGSWTNINGATGLQFSNTSAAIVGSEVSVTSGDRQTLRAGVRWKVANGQYDVRITRSTTTWPSGSSAQGQFGDVTWGALRSVHYQQASDVPNTVVLALRAQATDQLNGSINQFNLVAQSKLAVWDGSAWSNQATNNPAWVAVDILCGSANQHPADKDVVIDKAAFLDWANTCATAGREFNAVIDQQTTPWELLNKVFAAGRATPARIDGKWSVIQDVQQNTPVQHITPRNSWGFKGQRSFAQLPHAIRAQFANKDAGYQQDEIIVYADGYDSSTATVFVTMPFPGVTDHSQAWKMARYHLAVLYNRLDTYTVNMDLENLVARRGEMVLLAHDVISVGLSWGRVKSITDDGSGNAAAVILDETVTMEAGNSYAARIRKRDNSTVLQDVTTVAGDTDTLTFTASVAGLDIGDLVIFGVAGQETLECLISKIRPSADLSAELTLVDMAPAIYTADAGPVPAFVSAVTGSGSDCVAPPPPGITAILGGYANYGAHGAPSDNGGLMQPSYRINVGPFG